MGKRTTYVNAARILPPTLLREIQRYHQGSLWIPRLRRKERKFARRDRAIARERTSGKSVAELGRRYGLSPQRIRQIMHERRNE